MLEGDSSTRFSPSKLDTYKDCPRRYRFRYVDQIKRPSQSIEAFLGQCVHAAFEWLYEALQHGKRPTLSETFAAYERRWTQTWSEQTKIRGEFSAEDWRSLGRRCVETYYRANEPFDRDRTIAVEKKVGFELSADGQGYRIEGYVDRLAAAGDGVFEIHDYKTGKTLPTQAEVDADWQLAIYDVAVRQAWPDARETRLVWHYVRLGQTLVSRRTPQQLAQLKAEIAGLISQIKADREFAARKSALCDWCEYRDLCPVWSHAETLAKLPEPERSKDAGARLVAKLAAVEARKRELRDALKSLEPEERAVEKDLAQWARAAGVSMVYGAEGHASIAEKERLELPTKTHSPKLYEELEAMLRASPAVWLEVSHLDAYRLAEAFRRRSLSGETLAIVDSAVARFGRRVVEAVVRFHRATPEG